ncbi:MAG: hypothetical protein K0R09_2719 [Clostridiales bacterium]|jgi:hypothetical protein|nr:hypothetical protein [Clostridiales bacterium]
MELNSRNESRKSRESSVSIVMYVVASLVIIFGIAALVNSILLFNSTVAQYVAQGYPVEVVSKQLQQTQLLPAVFQLALYCGVAFLLFGIGILNKKISNCLGMLDTTDVCNEAVEESIIEQNSTDAENIETPEQTEVTEEINNVE